MSVHNRWSAQSSPQARASVVSRPQVQGLEFKPQPVLEWSPVVPGPVSFPGGRPSPCWNQEHRASWHELATLFNFPGICFIPVK